MKIRLDPEAPLLEGRNLTRFYDALYLCFDRCATLHALTEALWRAAQQEAAHSLDTQKPHEELLSEVRSCPEVRRISFLSDELDQLTEDLEALAALLHPVIHARKQPA